MRVEGEHLETQTVLLTQIRDLLDAQGRRVLPDMQSWSFNVSQSGANLIVPPMGQRIFVASYVLVAASAVNAAWGMSRSGATGAAASFHQFAGVTDSTSGGHTGEMALAANGGVAHVSRYPQFVARCDTDTGLSLFLSGAVQVGGQIVYWVA